ncbi:hypothetical protein IEQ34_025603 [Dendrobium chrysotoxum]|uniref:NADH:quinone oxidoreductase/Mrp antiporter transmembrane domain-containing protein n=1 Tax=Dendrobium chrysotoxum TaxID=161865 RepID=A0AAV7FQ28_DENCH|nr:hypothetical protein IEQ34_025603 [Dendrobium chrysotoxum]
MGAYGLIRINMELLAHAHSRLSPWLVIVGIIQIIYAASTSLGIGSITGMGLNGAILQRLSHGLIGAALFFLAGTSCDRIRFVYLEEMGGISIPMPKIFTMFSSFSMASLALPGMSGFVAEFLVFFGRITSPKSLFMPKMLITFVMAIGMIFTPIFFLSMLRQIFYGYKLFNIPNSNFFDSGPRELFVSICIFLPVIGIGLYPDFVLPLSVDKSQSNSLRERLLSLRGPIIGCHSPITKVVQGTPREPGFENGDLVCVTRAMCSCASSSKGVSRKPRLGSGSCRAAGKDVAIYGPWAMDLVRKSFPIPARPSSSSSFTEDSFELRVLLEPFSAETETEGTSVNPTIPRGRISGTFAPNSHFS